MKKTAGIVLLSIGLIIALAGTVTLLSANATSGSGISIIGGADGPTAIFLAGKIGVPLLCAIIAGIVLTVIGVFVLLKKKKSK
ncbi:hypothetical protein [Ruminococcus sp. HUN007]|uniref:hypothetical protein n=1 Tax=Ruminococcus sp. HUN007 TaxID=1514668 RepID=UPI0005D2682E|nr:hypothetical protein [Ruminococcus sp. HUN007]